HGGRTSQAGRTLVAAVIGSASPSGAEDIDGGGGHRLRTSVRSRTLTAAGSMRSGPPGGGVADARVDQGIDQVHHQVGYGDRDEDQQNAGLNHRKVQRF